MISLDQYLISAPLSTMLALLGGLSLLINFDCAGQVIFRRADPLSRALYYFSGLLIVSWSSWLLALTGLAYPLTFKLILWSSIAVASFLVLSKKAKFIFARSKHFLADRRETSLFPAMLIGLICLGYLIISLAVPTDSDSLSYHLALPVDVLSRGNLWFDPDQLHFRMAGFGEMLNVLGVANGCPQLGAVIQVFALFHFLEALSSGAGSDDWKKSVLLALSIPTLLFLIPGQKHQLTGMLATTICFLALYQSYQFNQETLLLWLTVLLFAAGIKYSQLMSGGVLVLLFLLKRPANIPFGQFITLLFGAAWIFLGPQVYFKWSHLGDPFSPLLEKFTTYPDPVVRSLHSYIKNYRESRLPFPFSLVVPSSFGRISACLGISVLVLCVLPFARSRRVEAGCIALLLILIGLGGQLSSRFFMEPIFWGIPLFVTFIKRSNWLSYLMLPVQLQGALVLLLIGFGVFQLAPSLFSNAGREKVLRESAEGYAESRWLDEQLPKNASIATFSRSRAFLPRKYFAWEYMVFTKMDDRIQVNALRKKLLEKQISYVILPTQGYQDFRDVFAGQMVSTPKSFTRATRNPFNKTKYELGIYRLRTE